MVDYNYSVTGDFPANAVAVDRLTLEVRQSTIAVALDGITVSADDVTVAFKAALSGAEQSVLDAVVAAHSGVALPNPVSSNGIPKVVLDGQENRVQVVGRKGSEFIQATHDFSDPTTWYSESVRVVEVLTNPSADGVTWVSSKKNWINPLHPKLHHALRVVEEGKAAVGDQWGYLPQVRVGGVVQEPRPRRASDWSLGGDYVIDHLNGVVTFQSAPAQTPQATFHYAEGSALVLAPKAGKRIEIEMAEVQWSADADFNCEIVQEVQVPDGQGGWVVYERTFYQSFWAILLEARGSFPKQGPVGGSPAWRGTSGQQLEHAPLVYNAVKDLPSSLGVRMLLYLGHVDYNGSGQIVIDKVEADSAVAGAGFGGGHASATFYAVSVDE